jgi:Cu+-exporting ATPase
MRGIVWLALAVALGGCAGAQLPPLAADHPANPSAPEGAPVATGSAIALPHVAAAPAATPAGQGYTCPMHPAVHSTVPGQCPLCGMTLVPAESGEPGHAH